MNWKKIFTIAALTGFSASVATGQGTAPTIVQGDYISNVFGQSNFIKNPNAKLNAKDVTVSSATVSRSATTPLVATSEFNVAVTLANGTATWATRTFDAGMKNQNCEARFSYRGFQSTSKAQVKQGANVVAELALSATGTDPRIASINFPCGDLSQPTTFVVTDTAVLAGTNEIGGIYVGLATNQANVAQAETVVIATRSTTQSVATATDTTVIYATEEVDALNEYDTSTGVFTAKRAGRYFISAQTLLNTSSSWNASEVHELKIKKNSTVFAINRVEVEVTPSTSPYMWNQVNGSIEVAVGDTIQVQIYQNSGSSIDVYGPDAKHNRLQISRFPTSSELVVTPERQNTFASVRLYANTDSNGVTSASWTKLTAGSTATRITYGKADTTATNDYSITIKNMPVGSYDVSTTGTYFARAAASPDVTGCWFSLSDSPTAATPFAAMAATGFSGQDVITSTLSGVYVNTSVADRTFYVRAYRSGGTGSCRNFSGPDLPTTITVTPLDQPSNSALFVEGPVKASATGAAIPAGYVGEEKLAVATTSYTATANTEVDIVGASITLDPGVWELQYSASVLVERTPASAFSVVCRIRIRDSSNNVESSTEAALGLYSNTSDISWNFADIGKTKRITLTTSKTFKLSITAGVSNTVGNCGALTGSVTGNITGNEGTTYIRAVRIN